MSAATEIEAAGERIVVPFAEVELVQSVLTAAQIDL
jgi:hypothetical protein